MKNIKVNNSDLLIGKIDKESYYSNGITTFVIVIVLCVLSAITTYPVSKPYTPPNQVSANEIGQETSILRQNQSNNIKPTQSQYDLDPQKIQKFIYEENVSKVLVIEGYLKSYSSPHPELAGEIVYYSQKYGVDPYIITAINCQESSCFKHCSSGNCSGYGITDTKRVGKTEFENKESGLEHMIWRYSEDWNGYYKKCSTDINCISYKYNNRDSWRSAVKYFYNSISAYNVK